MNLSLYSPRQEENIYIRKQTRTWKRSGLITDSQLTAMDVLTNTDVRQTNIFFRVIFFIFTYHCVAAMVGLFAWITKIRSSMAISSTLIIAGVIFYFLAEYLITKYRFYRHGIEEALAVFSMLLLCAGLFIGATNIFSGGRWTHQHAIFLCLLFAVSACWIYLRFGYLYAALISVVATCTIPFQLSLPPAGERVLLLIVLCLIFFLNVILVILSIIINRWLNTGENKARDGFTAENILKPESHGIGLADVAAALTPMVTNIEVQQQGKYFDGGTSGGGETSRGF
jgi:hypothetical protein